MSDERIAALEELVTNMRIDHARMSQVVENLSDNVDGLTKAVDKLTEYMNRGQGALWVFGAMAGTIGGVITWATTLLFHKS